MFTKQIMLDRMQILKNELDALMQYVSTSDKVALEEELEYYFEAMIDNISLRISFTVDLYAWKQRGITLPEAK